MRFQFLGTAAAEGMPALWCECETCCKARASGKDLRRRASYLVDDDTMIDFGPDVFWQTQAFGIDLTRIRRLLITHNHSDHLDAVELEWRRNGFSKVSRVVRILGSSVVLSTIMEQMGRAGIYEFGQVWLEPVPLTEGQPLTDGDLTILPLRADHAPGRSPQFHRLERGGRRVLVANDTGFDPDSPNWDWLRGERLDLAVIECTYGLGFAERSRGHMGAAVAARFAGRLREIGCADADTRFFVTHFSHNAASLHADLERYFAPLGIGVAYDGLVVEV